MSQITGYFSPKGGCEAAVVAAIGGAKSSVRVLAYSFTSAPIAAALVAALSRGVAVTVVADPGAQLGTGSKLAAVQAAGALVLIDSQHHLMHDKVMIVDERTVITGSFNFTFDAEHGNAENLLVVNNKTVAALYLANFTLHAQHATAAAWPASGL